MLTRDRNPLADVLTDIITFGRIPPRFPTYEINREIEKQIHKEREAGTNNCLPSDK